MKPEDFKKALEEASYWERVLTEEESTKMPYNEARKIVLKRIFDKWQIKLNTSPTK